MVQGDGSYLFCQNLLWGKVNEDLEKEVIEDLKSQRNKPGGNKYENKGEVTNGDIFQEIVIESYYVPHAVLYAQATVVNGKWKTKAKNMPEDTSVVEGRQTISIQKIWDTSGGKNKAALKEIGLLSGVLFYIGKLSLRRQCWSTDLWEIRESRYHENMRAHSRQKEHHIQKSWGSCTAKHF